jgi:hypothetical protein
MQVSREGLQRAGWTGGRKRGVHDQDDRDHGNVPSSCSRPVLGVLDVIGAKLKKAFVIEVDFFRGLDVARLVWLRRRSRQETFKLLHCGDVGEDGEREYERVQAVSATWSCVSIQVLKLHR